MLMTSHLRMNGFQIKGLLPEKLTAAPSNPVDGQEYFDTSLNVERQRIAGAWVNFIMSSDSRLADGRAPIGNAGGSLTGTYPNPSLATGAVDLSNLATSLKDGTASSYQVRQLGTAAGTAAAGNDPRLNDSRTPSGAAGGALNGNYPNPGLADGSVTQTKLADISIVAVKLALALYTSGFNYGYGAGTAGEGVPALRHLGKTNGGAMPGYWDIATLAAQNPTTGNVNMQGNTFLNLAAPQNAADAATKQYVDNAIQGLTGKNSVKAATTAAVTMSGTQVVDGYSSAVGDRILVKNQGDANNGIWIVQSGAWTRAVDADVYTELVSAFVFVENGSTQADTGWLQGAAMTSLNDVQNWIQFSAAGTILPGTGLFKTGNTLNVNYDGTTISVDGSNRIFVRDTGISTSKLADGAVTSVKLGDGSVDLGGAKVVGTAPISKGGTGATSAAAARSNLSAAGSAQANAPALTADTWATVYHGLNVTYPAVTVWEISSGEVVEMDVKYVDANNIQIRSGASAVAAAYTVRVVG